MKKLFVALMTASMLFVLFSCNNNTPKLTNSITLSTDTVKNNCATTDLDSIKIADITVAPDWIDYELKNTLLDWSYDATLTVDGEVKYDDNGLPPLAYLIDRSKKALIMYIHDIDRKEYDRYIEVKPPSTFRFYTPSYTDPVQLCEAHLDTTYNYTLDGNRVELTGVDDTPDVYELMDLDIAVLTGIADIDTIASIYARPRDVNQQLLVDGVNVPIDGEKIQISYYNMDTDEMTIKVDILGLDRTPQASAIAVQIDGTFKLTVDRKDGECDFYTGYLDTEYKCTLSGTEMTLNEKLVGGRIDSLDKLKIATISYKSCWAGGGLNNAIVAFEGTETLYVNGVETTIDGETINITYYSDGSNLLAAITGVDQTAGKELRIGLKLDGTFTFTTTGTYGTAVYEAPLKMADEYYVPGLK